MDNYALEEPIFLLFSNDFHSTSYVGGFICQMDYTHDKIIGAKIKIKGPIPLLVVLTAEQSVILFSDCFMCV